MGADRPRVLLVNDDGPPGPVSPYIFTFYKRLTNDLGWDVKVVLPSSQKSWIGKAYHINEITHGKYFYPKDPDGLQGETSLISRDRKDGEVAEWILLDGTPAACTNISLHNLYPGQIDLVLSGPNFGRNTSAASCLSSGTIGGAMCGALSKTRSIALSYGNVHHPTPSEWYEPANDLAVRILKYLWDHWGKDPGGIRDGEVDLYTVNIPVIPQLTTAAGIETYWAPIWRSSYGRMFKTVQDSDLDRASEERVMEAVGSLSFKWGPDLSSLIFPDPTSLPVGSDSWALGMGYATVTPLRACFAEAQSGEIGEKPTLLTL